MAKTIKVKEMGELINEEPFDMNWFSYNLGGGWGAKLNRKNLNGINVGSFVQGINKDTSVQKVMKNANKGNFDDICGFYPAIFMFFGERFIDKVDFCDPKQSRHRISRLVDNLKAPKHLEDEIRHFVRQDFDFIAFIEACGRNDNLFFDADSAIAVYKLQGDASIYPLLCQMFYVNKGINCLTACLIDGLNTQLTVEISDYVSGCAFPVAVSPKVSATKWDFNDNGWFLYGKLGDDWLVMDCVGVGRMNLANYALTNRLNYLGGGGRCLPYIICWNWGEVIDAYHHFGSDLLIRDLKNTIFDHYWFNFGLSSYLNVEFQNNLINYRSDYEVSVEIGADIPTGQKHYLTVQLDGTFVKYCDANDVCYSKAEVYDWFELASFLK